MGVDAVTKYISAIIFAALATGQTAIAKGEMIVLSDGSKIVYEQISGDNCKSYLKDHGYKVKNTPSVKLTYLDYSQGVPGVDWYVLVALRSGEKKVCMFNYSGLNESMTKMGLSGHLDHYLIGANE